MALQNPVNWKKLSRSGRKEDTDLKSQNDNGIIDRSSPSRNFKYLDDLIHSGIKEIVLDSDIVLSKDEEPKYLEGIKLDWIDDLVIDGNGFSIDACGKTRIFHCMGSKNIIIKNITLKNGHALSGGALDNSYGGSLFIIKSKFSSNTALTGGAIDNNMGGKLTISESTFCENIGQGSGFDVINGGGAIRNNDGELIVTKSKFHNNKSDGAGGAIYNKEGGFTIKDSFLNNNKSNSYGGAICNHEGGLKVIDCEIHNNKSPYNIISNRDLLQVYNCVFSGNRSESVILNEGLSKLGIFYGEFKDNNVCESVIVNNGKSGTIQKSVFENNILNSNSKNIINLCDLTLINPKIKDNGKTVLNEGYIFVKNSSKDLLSNIDGEGTVETTRFDPIEEKFDFSYLNKKIEQCSIGKLILNQDICFEKYESDFYEGGIELDMDNFIIDGNGHTIDGSGMSRIFIITGNNVTLKNITFKNGYSHRNPDNHFNNHGGAIKINHKLKLTIENCKFTNNTSEGNGGAINSNESEFMILKSEFAGNLAMRVGGAINSNDDDFTVIETLFRRNRAYHDGGAIYDEVYVNDECNQIIMESTFCENEVKKNGGAIYNCGILTINESKIIDNGAKKKGGGIYNCCLLTVSKSMLNGNLAGEYGGAIYNGDVFNINQSSLNGNLAYIGGAIYDNGRRITINESILQKNEAQKDSGAIYLSKESKYESDSCTFKDNKPDNVFRKKD